MYTRMFVKSHKKQWTREKETVQIENYRITGKGGGIKWKSDKNCQEKGLGVREEWESEWKEKEHGFVN